MFTLSLGIGELILRGAIVYIALFILLRAVGTKHVGQMAPFDLLVLLILSESVQNALISDDKSITAGLITVGTLFAIDRLLSYASWRSKAAERLLEGTPRLLVRNGTICSDALAQEQITRSELMEALRREGCTAVSNVRYAVLENGGTITVGLREPRT
jgi:uncharacterized membrane protein YcaP (DUF421 family)